MTEVTATAEPEITFQDTEHGSTEVGLTLRIAARAVARPTREEGDGATRHAVPDVPFTHLPGGPLLTSPRLGPYARRQRPTAGAAEYTVYRATQEHSAWRFRRL
ncbi:MAG: hypothetical protein M3Q29_06685 [Chloroflexota bacterium]|nr:hypothetical protein [Chloroflexota bacterium]